MEVITNDLGCRNTPSFVAFTYQGRLIGEVARRQQALNPSNTIYDAKRFIGWSYQDSHVQKNKGNYPFVISEDKDRLKLEVQFRGERKKFLPEEISAMMLAKMKETAEDFLGHVSQASHRSWKPGKVIEFGK